MGDEYDLVPVSHDPFPDAQYGKFDQGDPYGDLTRYAHATPLASGDILPISRYADGSVRFDPHAGLLGPITGMPAAAHQAGRELSGDVPPSTDYPSGPSMDLIGKAADTAGLLTLGAGAVPAEPGSLRAGITAYHGGPGVNSYTGKGISELRPNSQGLVYLTDNQDLAGDYAKARYGDKGMIHTATIAPENPLIVDRAQDLTPQHELIQRAQENGHDAVILRNADDGVSGMPDRGNATVYIMRDPSKIELHGVTIGAGK